MSLDYIDPNTLPPPDWAGAVFPDPMVYRLAPLWLFLLLLAVLGLLFYRSRLLDARSEGRRGPTIIFREVRGAIDRALRATGPETISEGRRVIETMKLYLGPILILSAELGGAYGKLKKAVAGEAGHDEHPKAHGAHDHAKEEAKTGKVIVTGSGQEGSITADKVIQVIGPAQVIAIGAPHGEHEPHCPMPTHEQTAAVRYALERLHEYWTFNTIEPRLRAIQDALSICEPKGVRLSREPYPARFTVTRRTMARTTEVKAKA